MLLTGIFFMLANITQTPEVNLSPAETEKLMERINNVQRHYDLRTTQKMADWAMLGFCLTGLAIPRAAAVYYRHYRQPAPQPAAPAGQINGAGIATAPNLGRENLVADGPPLPIPPGAPPETFH